MADTFGQLGIGVALGDSRVTGPLLAKRLHAIRNALCRLSHLATFDHCVRAVNTLVMPLALHGVAMAPITDSDLGGVKRAVLQAIGGATRLS